MVFGMGTMLQAQEYLEIQTEVKQKLILEVEGLKSLEGELRVAIFNSKETYTKVPVYTKIVTVDSTTILLNVENLPFGEYAVAVYHDKNKNEKLDTNLLGIPKERYGFSNNARGRFGPASWEDAFFSFKEEINRQKINLK